MLFANRHITHYIYTILLLLPFLYIHTCVIFNKCIQTFNIQRREKIDFVHCEVNITANTTVGAKKIFTSYKSREHIYKSNI